MSHSIQISDELWEAYDGSPSKMRDTLWQALVPIVVVENKRPQPDFEKSIVLQWDTHCSVCSKPLFAGETAMYRVPAVGSKQIVCMDDARGSQTLAEIETELGLHSVKAES